MSKKAHRGKSKYRGKSTQVARERHQRQSKSGTPEKQTLSGDVVGSATIKFQAPGNISRKSQYSVADYRYVERDIRFIGILAGSLIAIIVILAFVLG